MSAETQNGTVLPILPNPLCMRLQITIYCSGDDPAAYVEWIRNHPADLKHSADRGYILPRAPLLE